jgi:hypothetical protein
MAFGEIDQRDVGCPAVRPRQQVHAARLQLDPQAIAENPRERRR